MTKIINEGSSVEFFTNVYKKLIDDEGIMRLLLYPPKGYDNNGNYNPDPLDIDLPNLVDAESDDYWKLVDERVILGEKTSELLEEKICKIYIYEGRRRPVFDNYLVATQEINIDVFIHESFDRDLRMTRLSDRVNQLIALERIAGIGKLEYKAGNPREAPTHYRRFLHQYTMTVGKK